jgi:hypothetical protein
MAQPSISSSLLFSTIYRYCLICRISRREGFYAPPVCHPSCLPSHDRPSPGTSCFSQFDSIASPVGYHVGRGFTPLLSAIPPVCHPSCLPSHNRPSPAPSCFPQFTAIASFVGYHVGRGFTPLLSAIPRPSISSSLRFFTIYSYYFTGGISRREGFYAPPVCHPSCLPSLLSAIPPVCHPSCLPSHDRPSPAPSCYAHCTRRRF